MWFLSQFVLKLDIFVKIVWNNPSRVSWCLHFTLLILIKKGGKWMQKGCVGCKVWAEKDKQVWAHLFCAWFCKEIKQVQRGRSRSWNILSTLSFWVNSTQTYNPDHTNLILAKNTEQNVTVKIQWNYTFFWKVYFL